MCQTLTDKVCMMLTDDRMLRRYWREAFGHMTNIRNCTISIATLKSTHHQSLFGVTRDNSRLRMFGYAAFTCVDKAAQICRTGRQYLDQSVPENIGLIKMNTNFSY